MKNIDEINAKIKKLDKEIEETEELLIKNLKLCIVSQDDKYKYDMITQLINELEKERKSKIDEIMKLYKYKNNKEDV